MGRRARPKSPLGRSEDAAGALLNAKAWSRRPHDPSPTSHIGRSPRRRGRPASPRAVDGGRRRAAYPSPRGSTGRRTAELLESGEALRNLTHPGDLLLRLLHVVSTSRVRDLAVAVQVDRVEARFWIWCGRMPGRLSRSPRSASASRTSRFVRTPSPSASMSAKRSRSDCAKASRPPSESESEPLASVRAAASSSCCAAARASFASRSRGLSSGASPAASSTAFSRFRQSLTRSEPPAYSPAEQLEVPRRQRADDAPPFKRRVELVPGHAVALAPLGLLEVVVERPREVALARLPRVALLVVAVAIVPERAGYARRHRPHVRGAARPLRRRLPLAELLHEGLEGHARSSSSSSLYWAETSPSDRGETSSAAASSTRAPAPGLPGVADELDELPST